MGSDVGSITGANEMTNDLIARLRSPFANIAFGAAQEAATALEAKELENAELKAEVAVLRGQLEVARSGCNAAIDMARWQCVTNAELNAVVAERDRYKALIGEKP